MKRRSGQNLHFMGQTKNAKQNEKKKIKKIEWEIWRKIRGINDVVWAHMTARLDKKNS